MICVLTTNGVDNLHTFETDILPTEGAKIEWGEGSGWRVGEVGFRIIPKPGAGHKELIARIWVISNKEYLERDL